MTKLFYVTRVSAQKKIGSKYDAIILFVFSPSWEYLRQLERDYPDQILIKESLRTLRTKKRQPEQRRWKTNNFSRRPSEGHNAESRSNQFEVHSTSHHFDWNLVDVARRSGHELFKKQTTKTRAYSGNPANKSHNKDFPTVHVWRWQNRIMTKNFIKRVQATLCDIKLAEHILGLITEERIRTFKHRK